MTDIAVIILTGREERHIGRCLERLVALEAKQVFVVESQKGDRTHEIAVEKGATCVWHDWPGTQSVQLNWALENLPIEAKWILRLDADEYLYEDTIEEVKGVLPGLPEDVTSLSMSLARIWQGKRIRRGTGKVILTRFFRYGIGRCEERQMDEHIVTSRGRDVTLKGELGHEELLTMREWTIKHLDYAEREARELLAAEMSVRRTDATKGDGPKGQAGVKRKLKGRYGRLPLFWRSFAYFLYRYFLRGGFLEGRAGFTWHFFQGWWYRAMVDARIEEIKRLEKGPGD